MMKKILYILLLAVMASCTAPLDINTRDAESVITIYSAIDDSVRTQRVSVSWSRPFYSSAAAQPVLGATVSVTRDYGEVYPFTFLGGEDNYYVSQNEFGAVEGHTYKLSVSAIDKLGKRNEYTATSTTPEARSLDSIKVIETKIMGNYPRYMIMLWLSDPPEPNYYLVYISQNGILRNGKISEIEDYRDDYPFYFNGQQNINPPLLKIFNSKQSWEATPEAYHPKDGYYFEAGDTITVQMANVEEGYLSFIEQCQSSTYGSNPMMGGQPSNIVTNLSGGALGYFATYCLRARENYVPDAE